MQVSSPKKVVEIGRKNDTKTFIWWECLRAIAVVNMVLWQLSFGVYKDQSSGLPSYAGYQIYLSLIYVLVCAYRSVYPRIDLERYCLFDTQISSIFLGRSAATVAEICYSCQFALILSQIQETCYEGQYLFMVPTATKVFVPLITIAQMCCWRAILVNKCFWHAIEESIWAVCSLMLCTCFGSIFLANGGGGAHKDLIHGLCFIGAVVTLGYFAFMAYVDVPMYIEKSRNNVGNGLRTKNILKDLWSRRTVTSDWKVWREEAPWLTGYFSMAVWISISIVHVSLALEK